MVLMGSNVFKQRRLTSVGTSAYQALSKINDPCQGQVRLSHRQHVQTLNPECSVLDQQLMGSTCT